MYGDIKINNNLRVYINGYHISVFASDRLVFSRAPAKADWLDKDHENLIAIIKKLEETLTLIR